MHYPEPISKLMESFMKLPGIGPKTAARLAFFVLGMKDGNVSAYARALVDAKRNLSFCSLYGHISDLGPCHSCQDQRRDHTTICVVPDPNDVIAMERMRAYK